MGVYDVFINFFYALDYIFDIIESKELGDYLSGANPFLFEGIGSADPAIYDEFEKAYVSEFGTSTINSEKAYNWLISYVDKLNNNAVKSAFGKISLDTWLNATK
jgi:hypothetical protein